MLTHSGPQGECCCGAEPGIDFYDEDLPKVQQPSYILYATETCPNCKLAAAWLDKAGIPYEKRYVSEHEEEAKALGLKQAPSLVVDTAGDTAIFVGAQNIKKFIDKK